MSLCSRVLLVNRSKLNLSPRAAWIGGEKAVTDPISCTVWELALVGDTCAVTDLSFSPVKAIVKIGGVGAITDLGNNFEIFLVLTGHFVTEGIMGVMLATLPVT